MKVLCATSNWRLIASSARREPAPSPGALRRPLPKGRGEAGVHRT